MPPLGVAAENFNIGAQLAYIFCPMIIVKSLPKIIRYWFWCAQSNQSRPIFLALEAQIWHCAVSVCKQMSEKLYIDARLQYNGYKVLVEFYL